MYKTSFHLLAQTNVKLIGVRVRVVYNSLLQVLMYYMIPQYTNSDIQNYTSCEISTDLERLHLIARVTH